MIFPRISGFMSRKKKAGLSLRSTEPDSDLGCLWYKDQQKWIRAELHKGKPVIPSDVFEFSIQRQDPVIEGNALIAFANEDEEPVDWNSRELDVHIW